MKSARQLCESLDWMRINGKPDFEQWENHILSDRAEVRREVVEEIKNKIRKLGYMRKETWTIPILDLADILDAIAEGEEK